jgi:putative sterol carrier protein
MGMAGATKRFFDALERRGHEPLLESFSGVMRFDLAAGGRTQHWYLTIHKGDVVVARRGPEPDCVLSGDLETFDAIASGRRNAMAALLRGELDVAGRTVLLLAVQRLFPGSPGLDDGKRARAGYARRQS